MPITAADNLDNYILRSVIEHIFMPPKLPQKHPGEETERKINVLLCNSLIAAAKDFLETLHPSESPLWTRLIKMMELVRRAANTPFKEDVLQRALSDMTTGDIFCMHIRAQNAALIVRRLATADVVQFEVFEVLPLIRAVMAAEGKLLCSYPGPAIQIPTDIFMDECFLRELSSFLVQMDLDHLPPTPSTNFARRCVHDGAHPGYISELLVGILRGYGQPAVVDRITKRIGDEVLLDTAVNSPLDKQLPRQDKRQDKQGGDKPWRRSPLWLILRVSLQISLSACGIYKPFILFFHAHLLRTCTHRDFPSELLYVMRVKMVRRLSKLGPAVSDNVYRSVHDAAILTETLLSKRWTEFQNTESITNGPILPFKELDFVADTQISLDNSYNYIMKMLRFASRGSSRSRFTPSHTSRFYEVHDFSQFRNGQLAKAIAEDPGVAIADFELSVEKNLGSWAAASTNIVDSSEVIASCIEQYFSGAKDFYGTNAEDTSIMILTIMDLWVVLDRFATQECPLLKQYSPEIPTSFIHCLLLHRSSNLKRALDIEEYLRRRHEVALDGPSIFSNNVDDFCFALKYYRTSENLRHLYDRINVHAQRERMAKREELASSNKTARCILSQASKMKHKHDQWRKTFLGRCQKCELESQANAHSIQVHEWPLPPSTVHAQWIVFELSPPRAFSAWRDITYMILRDIGMPSVADLRVQPESHLNSFPGLQRWAVQKQYRRVTMASAMPSFSGHSVRVPAEESSVLLGNQLSFKLFDHIHNSWVVESFSESSPSTFCVPPIPKSSPYSHLHSFVSGTKHTPNEIITTQADCPKEISQHEFLAFSGLRSGPRLQWLNIARELASPFLSFSREEVHTLITQAAWQLGPLSGNVREWHADLTVSSFGNALLHEMECLLLKIKANWLEEVTIRTIALICNRLLASTTDPDVSDRTYALLRKARNAIYRWIIELQGNLDSLQDETSRAGLQHQLCMLAATCLSTFDVCSEQEGSGLVSDEDISLVMQCAVIIHDNMSSSLSDDNTLYRTRLLGRCRRILHNLESIFRQKLPPASGQAGSSHAGAYDDAFSRLRPGHRQANSLSWCALSRPNSRWICCVTSEGEEVYYDSLTGELLIGGKRLEKLPHKILYHPTYTSIFGDRTLDVSPTNVYGMDYKARSTVSGYQILFSWNNGDLVLLARNPENSQILQLIPRPVLLGDFPRQFVDEYIHWLDLRTGELEFRPTGSPWMSGPSNWRLYIQRQRPGDIIYKKRGVQRHAILQKPSQNDSPMQVIDIRSSTFTEVSSLLSSLESPEHIIAMYTAESLEVSLPRLRLSFFVNTNWELECRTIPGYIIDTNQSCGTMFGLRNKLVLSPRPSSSEVPLLPRRIIIPEGKVYFSTDGDFANVSINTDAGHHVRWHEYTLDSNLRCLTSNVNLSSKLYQCYLHVLTSHCLPDPLLGHTGTEEALCILKSAACRSFQRLDAHNENLLKLISNLSPDRLLSHQWSTAIVKWNDLPALSQHHDFFLAVRSIFDHARALEALYDPPTVFSTSDRDLTSLNRAACRNELYPLSDLHTSEQLPTPSDTVYKSRDIFNHTTAEHVAYQTSWSVWNFRPSVTEELWSVMNSWGSLGPAASGISLRYSRYWVEFSAPRDWFVIYDLCREAVMRNHRHVKIELSFSLSAAAYSNFSYSNVTHFLMVFALDNRFRNLNPPPRPLLTCTLSHEPVPDRKILQNIVTRCRSALYVHGYGAAFTTESSAVVDSILNQWPDYKSVRICEQRFDRSKFNRHLEEYYQSISPHIRLKAHVMQLQSVLEYYKKASISATVPYVYSPQFVTSHSKAPLHSLRDVLASRVNVPTPPAYGEPFQCYAIPPTEGNASAPPQPGSESLETLIEEFRYSLRPLVQLYGNELNRSRRELLGQNISLSVRDAIPSHNSLLLYHKECSHRKDKLFSEISLALAPSQNSEETSRIAGLWPLITPRSILRQLAQDRFDTIPDQWKLPIICYAVSFLKHQQSLRLLELSLRQQHKELLQEIQAIRHDILTESSPDWLLVQIEAHLMARPVQVAVAREMISPTSKRNITLQLNMGEGKSSVIVPLVASTLANGSNLVRVLTLKPLSNQMFQLLVKQLSGLANRPIFYVPISRSLRMNTSLVRTIRGLFERCVADGGVLIVQPEHILSLRLMHINALLLSHSLAEQELSRDTELKKSSPSLNPGSSRKLPISRIEPLSTTPLHASSKEDLVAGEIGALQDWLAKVSRNVLDESDEILHVRYQLVYSSGEPMLVDDHRNRWTTIQQVFGLLQAHTMKLCAKDPKVLVIDTTLGGFPIIPTLDSSVIRQLSSLIIDDVLKGQLSNLPVGVIPLPIQSATRRFLSQVEVSDVDHDLIRQHFTGTTFFKGILLLRGLLMGNGGILGYVLKERQWRVDYGLDPGRTLLAVPYRAKDVPSLRAEFAHPDVAIALTCLSYYYGGLTKDQVLLCFNILSKLDNPEMEYDHWVELGKDLPVELRQFNGVNTDDETQVDGLLVPSFSRNKGAVDFYLSQVVFPRAVREFPSKLPTSAWDLVENKKNITTGFSGTNDSRYLLPTSITQEDPDFVLGTNALVLQHLLRSENDHYECFGEMNGVRESVPAFLNRLVKQDPEIRVLLDIGAQMVELQNEELGRCWLSLRPDVSAAIFFNDSDDLTVITPDGTIEPFISSPFNRQLEKCVVYLDDAHTRGTDLEIPQGMRAAVTLGPRVTKDRLVQGCMRMRQLGNGHSVMFFAPREIDHRIRDLVPSGMTPEDRIRVLDVVRWAIFQTCEDIYYHLPYWAHQGLDHHKRFAAYEQYRSSGEFPVLQRAWLQSDSRTLEEMFWITSGAQTTPEVDNVPSISERMEHLGITKLVDIRMAEEQEREVNREVHHEIVPGHFIDVERPSPPKVQPAQHVIHADILEFIKTGKVPQSSLHIAPLLALLNMDKALNSITEWFPSPLATADFITTVLQSHGARLTEYLRPVNWILSSEPGKDSNIVVISPYEANELLPIIRQSNYVRLRIYTPRVTSSMRSFSNLNFYSIPERIGRWSAPAHIRIELNLFAGQLYFDSREEYEKLCALLALSMAHPDTKYSDLDGFVPPEHRTGRRSPFERSKIPILKILMGFRQKGMSYHLTHLGQILNGKPLSDEALSGLLGSISTD